MTLIRVAAAQHAISAAKDWADFTAQMTQQVADAAHAGARLAVMAEYGSLALVAALADSERATLPLQLTNLQRWAQAYPALFQQLAQQYGLWLVAPSFPFQLSDRRYVNRAWIAGPHGQLHWQDKHHMTRFERELFDISPGEHFSVIDTGEFRFGVAICYDSEFPAQVHQLCQLGTQIIAVPSCTDAQTGYHRVMLCARARAIENQCFVVQAPLTGDAPWCDAIDTNVGTAGIYSPVDKGFPADGVLACGAVGYDGWILADCDLAAMDNVRSDGQVFNWRDSCADGNRAPFGQR